MGDDLAPAGGPRWVTLEGGSFIAGSDDFYPDEAPARERTVAAFQLATTPVTNRQFATFVEATGHLTVAERPLSEAEFPHLPAAERAPGSLVFTPTAGPVDLGDWRQWWRWVPGANWHHPRGTGEEARPDHPVVQVAYADAVAYARWAGGRLPTEDELEFAACGGNRPAPYAWGEERDPGGVLMANTWRGRFPYLNEGANGWVGTSPVGAFPANGYGLFDTIGNVWEWTGDLYDGQPDPGGCACGPDVAALRAAAQEPTATPSATRRVVKGGSHLCAPEYCLRYRPAARSPQSEDSATTHLGFRVARDA